MIKPQGFTDFIIFFSVQILFVVLCGCSANVDGDLVEFVKRTKSQKSEYIGELPKFPQAETFKYAANTLRSPFEPFIVATSEKPTIKSQGPGPDLQRRREALEAFPLDSLRMVGTLEREGQFFALLKDSSGIVHRVKIGNYVGQNAGRVEKISEYKLEVQEWLPDGKGGWKQHLAVIPLSKSK